MLASCYSLTDLKLAVMILIINLVFHVVLVIVISEMFILPILYICCFSIYSSASCQFHTLRFDV